jgi:threonyl-tRNA synthetase
LLVWRYEARACLQKALTDKNIAYSETTDSAAFYGPKIDVAFNSLGNKEIVLFTIQLDFQLPLKFEMTYKDKSGNSTNPVIIHRGLMCSYERMLGVLLEKYQGDMPFWLAPVQMQILQLDNSQKEYGESIQTKLQALSFRSSLKIIAKSDLSKQVGNSIKSKTHYIVTIGEKEVPENKVSVRYYKEQNDTQMPFEEFIEKLCKTMLV